MICKLSSGSAFLAYIISAFVLLSLGACKPVEPQLIDKAQTHEKTALEQAKTREAATSGRKDRNVIAITIAQGLNYPWGMVSLPGDKGIIITEKYGGIMLYKDGKLRKISGAPDAFRYGESGLLDVVIDPDFKDNRRVYISFVQGEQASNRNALFTAKLKAGALVDGAVIYTGTERKNSTRHSASRLVFMPDNTLLMSMGDGAAEAAQAQNKTSTLGKIVQLNRNGKPVTTQLFKAAVAGLYTMGHRNIEGLAIDPQTKAIWSTEHGPMGGDELNLIAAGNNYGWPKVTYGLNSDGTIISRNQQARGVTDPLAVWVPSIAPSGLAVYRGDLFPEWNGDILAGALSGRQLRRIRVKDNNVVLEEVMLRGLESRIRDVEVSPSGEIYILTDGENGKLRRLVMQ